jgi:hypothetical protein
MFSMCLCGKNKKISNSQNSFFPTFVRHTNTLSQTYDTF